MNRFFQTRKAALAATFIACWCGALACSSSKPGVAISPAARDSSPVQVVESFLVAAKGRDYLAMSWLFGTVEGPIGDTGGSAGCVMRKLGAFIGIGEACEKWATVELRMDAIARLLLYDSFTVRGQEQVAGRDHPATRIEMALQRGQRPPVTVPFVVIQDKDGGWLVQEIGLAQLTGSSSGPK